MTREKTFPRRVPLLMLSHRAALQLLQTRESLSGFASLFMKGANVEEEEEDDGGKLSTTNQKLRKKGERANRFLGLFNTLRHLFVIPPF